MSRFDTELVAQAAIWLDQMESAANAGRCAGPVQRVIDYWVEEVRQAYLRILNS